MAARRKGGIRLIDLAALTIIGVIAAALMLPAVRRAREPARRNQCSNKLKQIGIALQNYHDIHQRFPATSNQRNPDGVASVWWPEPGSAADDAAIPSVGYTSSAGTMRATAGYSWIVMILPYMDEAPLYNAISKASGGFKADAFTPFDVGAAADADDEATTFCVTSTTGGKTTRKHFATVQLDEVTCPSFSGMAAVATTASGANDPASPSLVPAAYGFPNGSNRLGSPARLATITNYIALSATHFPCMQYAARPKLAATTEIPTGAEAPNGMIVPGTGLNVKECRDGTSHTLMICETIEPAVNCWYDGTTAWTTGIDPNTIDEFPPDKVDNIWHVPTGGRTALNVGPSPDGTKLYCPAIPGYCESPRVIAWGPSSNHSGGVVLHAAVDASVHNVTTDIDPRVYMWLITIAGAEPRPDYISGFDPQ